MVASLLLLTSAAVGLSSGAEDRDPALDDLLRRGWAAVDHVECGGLSAGAYYEVSAEQGSVELYAALPSPLASHVPLPEPPYECRKIPKPHFVEEI